MYEQANEPLFEGPPDNEYVLKQERLFGQAREELFDFEGLM